MTQLFKIIDRFASFTSKAASWCVLCVATNFLLLENVARARRKFKKTVAKKKSRRPRRRRDEGEKVFQRETNKSGVAKFYIVIPDY